jgi:hypothetical protein
MSLSGGRDSGAGSSSSSGWVDTDGGIDDAAGWSDADPCACAIVLSPMIPFLRAALMLLFGQEHVTCKGVSCVFGIVVGHRKGDCALMLLDGMPV